MPRNIQHDDYESPDEYDEQETLISRSRSVRSRSVPRKNTRKTTKRPGSPNKSRSSSSLGFNKSGHDVWMTALKKRQGALNTGSGHTGSPRHKTPIEYWVDTLRKTGTGISTESSGRNTFTGLKKDNDINMAYYSTSHHLRKVMGLEKGKKLQDSPNKTSAGTPAYKTPEEYYDEVLELRKQISNLGHDNSTMKAKVRRLEEDKIKKDKEMESLLNPAKSDEIRRTLGDRKPDSGAVIHSLKQKILKLEMQLREKDNAHSKLLGDLKVTKIDEMKCQMEVMYEEIVRLQNSKDTGVVKSARTAGGKDNSVKVKALNETILRLNKNNERIESENRMLKEDLQRATDNEDKEDGRLTGREYEDMNKRQLLSTIRKLDGKIEKLERKMEGDNLSILSLEKSRANRSDKIDLRGSIEERLQQLDQRETQLLDELAKQKNMIQKLKEERLFYKQQCEEVKSPGRNTRSSPRRPNTRGSDSSRPPTGRRRSGSDEEDRIRQERLENLKQKSAASNIQRNWRKHRSQAVEENERKRQVKLREIRENVAARQIQNGWKDYQEKQHNLTDIKLQHIRESMAARQIQKSWKGYQDDKHIKNRHAKLRDIQEKNAAKTIQKGWRGHQEEQKRKFQERRVNSFTENRAARKIQKEWAGFTQRRDTEDASYIIQGALKGHQARRKRLTGYHTEDSTEDDSLEDATSFIQSNVRGHMGRRKNMKNIRYDSTDDEDYRGSRRPGSALGSRSSLRRSSRSPRTNYFSGHSHRGSHDEDDDDF